MIPTDFTEIDTQYQQSLLGLLSRIDQLTEERAKIPKTKSEYPQISERIMKLESCLWSVYDQINAGREWMGMKA